MSELGILFAVLIFIKNKTAPGDLNGRQELFLFFIYKLMSNTIFELYGGYTAI